VKGVDLSEIRTIVLSSVDRIGKRTLSVNNYGRFFMRLENRRWDVEYEVSPLRVPFWLKQLTNRQPYATLSSEED